MRNKGSLANKSSLPLLSRGVRSRQNTSDDHSYDVFTASPPVRTINPSIPAIRLVQATPDTTAIDASLPSIIAPKEHPSPRKKLIPKKSKLALLTSRATSGTREKDLSDVIRRVNAAKMEEDGTCNVTVNGGTMLVARHGEKSSRSTIDIYVDPSDDPDIGEIVVVKKKKSRAALDGIKWALGESTNTEDNGAPGATDKVKMKVEEKERWWSIGRGRKDSKSKEKEKENTKESGTGIGMFKLRSKAPSAGAVPPKPSAPRPRNHSLDSGLLLNAPAQPRNASTPYFNGSANASTPILLSVPTPSQIVTPAPQHMLPTPAPSPTTPSLTISAPIPIPEPDNYFSSLSETRQAIRPTPGLLSPPDSEIRHPVRPTPGLLSPPDSGSSDAFPRVRPDQVQGTAAQQGSLAIRAMKGFARIGSWAQLRNGPDQTEKKKAKQLQQRAKSSTSSWEVGALSSSPWRDDTQTTTSRITSTNASKFSTISALGHGRPPPISITPSSQSQLNSNDKDKGTDRRDSLSTLLSIGTCRTRISSACSSSGESGRPGSTYTASGEDTTTGSGMGGGKRSVKWGGVVIGGEKEDVKKEKKKEGKERKEKEKKDKEKKREEKEKEKKEKRDSKAESIASSKATSKSGRHSLEGRRRTPVMSVFPGLRMVSRNSMESEHSQRSSLESTATSVASSQKGQNIDGGVQVPVVEGDKDKVNVDTAGVNVDVEDEASTEEVDEEACVRLAVRVPKFEVHHRGGMGVGTFVRSNAQTYTHGHGHGHESTALPTVKESPDSIPPARPRPRPRPVSEQLLSQRVNVNSNGPGNAGGCDAFGRHDRPKPIFGSISGFDAESEEALSALQAANFDLASLINRLDLEATPDSKASRPVSIAPTTADPTTSTFQSGDGDSVALDESPLKRIARGRAQASLTSLRPYSQAEGKDKDATVGRSNGHVKVNAVAIPPVPVPPLVLGQPILPWAKLVPKAKPKESAAMTAATAETIKPHATYAAHPIPAYPYAETYAHPGEDSDTIPPFQPLQPPRYQLKNAPGIKTSSSDLRARAAPFMKRTPSVASSTFGTALVMNKIEQLQAQAQTQSGTQTPNSSKDGTAPSSRTFGDAAPIRYTLPSALSSSPGSSSVMTSMIEETPTRPGRGHKRVVSHIVPFVKKAVETIEARERERERETGKGSSSASGSAKSSTAPIRLATNRSGSLLDARTRKELGFKGTMGIKDEEDQAPLEEDDEDSDIPDELRVVLSQSNDAHDQFPVDVTDDTFSLNTTLDSVVPAQKNEKLPSLTTTASRLPPSPGLPPTAPLPTPSVTPQSLFNGLSPCLEPSPPAPSLLPFIDPSPSPSSMIFAHPLFSLPQVTVQPTSDDHANEADVDEPNAVPSSSHSTSGSDDDTKESFDFTGELKRLNESGGAHRKSFVEQLDMAFKTPAKVDIGGGLGIAEFLKGGDRNRGMCNEEEETAAEAEADLSIMVESLNQSFNNLLQPEASVASKASYGRLDTAFKFGGKPQAQVQPEVEDQLDSSIARELPGVAALSTSPSPEHIATDLPHRRSRSLSASIVEEDSSILRSIYAHAAMNPNSNQRDIEITAKMQLQGQAQIRTHAPQPSLSLESDTSSKRRARKAHAPAHARSSSDISFSGMSSFGAVRTKFEFGTERAPYYTSFQSSGVHARQESMFSIASISSYGEVISGGSKDPFSYGEEMSEERDGLADINEVMSTFDEKRRRKRFSTDSDVSSFYFRAPGHKKDHGRNQSVVSTNSMNGPPISLYNRSFAHKRNDSNGSVSSIAAAYGIHGASGGRAAWLRHQQDRSIDSVLSEFSAVRLGRPGVGDKMFESAAENRPLTSISASPPESLSGELDKRLSYDSILDDERRSTVDSIFDNTGQRSSMSSDSVFGYDPQEVRRNLFPPNLFRPVSIISVGNHGTGTPREDDTMITMLGGEHVRRRSIGSSFEASPCFRVEKQKRKHADFENDDTDGYGQDSPNKTRLLHQESVASSKFGEMRMSLAKNGLLHRNSLEDSCLSAEGEEDLSVVSARSAGFNRPAPLARIRNRPFVTVSQPPDTTPPLSSSEGSQSGSQSSIDVARLQALLQTASAGVRSSNARARARGAGHRRRPSQRSRGSVIGTIQEENPGLALSPSPNHRANRDSFESASSYSTAPREPTPVEQQPSVDIIEWDDESLVVGLRKYYALRSEADETITHSRIVWPDTPFSLHALQTFNPPDHPAGMQALLNHSQKSYVPLPTDWYPRRVRSRTSSMKRPSPYPRSHRPNSSGGSSTKSRRSSMDMSGSASFNSSRAALQPKNNNASPPPALAAITPFSPLAFELNNSSQSIEAPLTVIKPIVRPRVGSAARRNALGWVKRKTPKSNKTEGKSSLANKENEALGLLTSPAESLRIVRPRPRGRIAPMPTPRSTSMFV